MIDSITTTRHLQKEKMSKLHQMMGLLKLSTQSGWPKYLYLVSTTAVKCNSAKMTQRDNFLMILYSTVFTLRDHDRLHLHIGQII